MTEQAPDYRTNGNGEGFKQMMDALMLERRRALADELRAVESYLVQRGKVTNRLCKLGPVERTR